jgi:hypothetical protein
MEKMAEAVFRGEVKSMMAAVAMSKMPIMGYDPEIEREKLAFERVKWETEKEHEKERLHMEYELKKLELELKQAKIKNAEEANEIRKEEVRRAKEKEASIVYKAKLFGDSLRATVARMPSDAVELIPYFRNVEQLFDDFKVEKELRVHLLKPHLTEAARVLISRMDPVKAANYDEVKALLLHEFKLSPTALLDKFNGISRGVDETYTLYANRLKSVITYYVEARKATNYESLLDLLVCDRIKNTLSEAALKHILSLESNKSGNWLRLSELTDALDIYYDSHLTGSDKPRYVAGAVGSVGAINNNRKSGDRTATAHYSMPKWEVSKNKGQQRDLPKAASNNANNGRRCFICHSDQHLQSYHSNFGGNKHNAGNASNSAVNKNATARLRQVNSSNVVSAATEGNSVGARQVGDPDTSSSTDPGSVALAITQAASTAPASNVNKCIESRSMPAISAHICDVQPVLNDEHIDVRAIDADLSLKMSNEVTIVHDFNRLEYVNVCLSDDDENQCVMTGLCDSGAEISVVRRDAISSLSPYKLGTISLMYGNGQPVGGDLVRLFVRCADRPSKTVLFKCAVMEDCSQSLLLAANVVNKLMDALVVNNNAVNDDNDSEGDDDADDDIEGGNASNDDVIDGNNDPSQAENSVVDERVINSNADTVQQRNSDAEVLRNEQLNDESLKGCFSLAKRGKGKLFLKNGVLHRYDSICGQQVEQLVLPLGVDKSCSSRTER